METKKSLKADLEEKRWQRFLLGLVVALALLFVSLEYSYDPDDPLDDPELLEMLESEAELPPLMRPENELSLAPKAEPKPAVKLKVVEEDVAAEEEEEEREPEAPVEGDVPDDDLPEPDEEKKEEEPALSFRVVEEIPVFPGGPIEFMKWLTRNLKYPASAQERHVQGKVIAEFIVNTDGSITDVRIASSLDGACDREALRVLRMMPRWTAGIDKGKPCRTKISMPIVFKM